MAEGTPEESRPMIYAVAAAVGVVVFVLFLVTFDYRFIGALFWAIVLSVLVLLFLLWRGGLSPFSRLDEPSTPASVPAPVRSVPVDAPKPILKPASERPAAAKAASDDSATASEAVADAPPQEPGAAEASAPPDTADEQPSAAEASAPPDTADEQPSTAEAIAPPETADEQTGETDPAKDDDSVSDTSAADTAAPAEGARPSGLDGPRDGTSDDLKKIKGVGPKLEALCNSLGFYHFDQIAAWSEAEVAWVDQNLQGFKGRVTRDDWVAQAAILAAGGETEFSRKKG